MAKSFKKNPNNSNQSVIKNKTTSNSNQNLYQNTNESKNKIINKKNIQKNESNIKNKQPNNKIKFQSNPSFNKLQNRNNFSKRLQKQSQSSEEYQNQQIQFDAMKNIKLNKNDHQYQKLINQSTKGFKRQKNIYFLQNQKYKGKQNNQIQKNDEEEQEEQEMNYMESQDKEDSQNQEEMDFENEEEIQQELIDQQQIDNQNQDYGQDSQQQDELQDQQSEENQNQIQKALQTLKQKRNQTTKLLSQQIKSINKQDKQSLIQLKKQKQKTTTEEYQEAVQLKKVLQIYDHLVSHRYNQQKQLQDFKMYPKLTLEQGQDQVKFPPYNETLHQMGKKLEKQTITNLSELFELYKLLGKKCGFDKKNQDEEDSENQNNQKFSQQVTLEELIQQDCQQQEEQINKKLNVDKIYSFIQQNITPYNNQVQKQLIKWSQKTSFIGSTNSSQYNSLIMQTPIGQAKKVLSNWQRMAHKCQQKRGTAPFKILFENEQNIHQTGDPQIYDDYDLFLQLQKYYLQKLDNDQDGTFLQSATMKYLKNRQSNQLHKQVSKKQVDRKASKNRKIRFNAHIKLLNFMPSIPQNCIQTRDQIVKNIFNCNAGQNQNSMQGNVNKYKMEHKLDQEADFIEVA